MPELPVEQDDGCILLTFDRIREHELTRLEPSAPLTAALVVLWHDDKCLLVLNRFRQAWELPGGMLEPGESARTAARRELLEESGQEPDTLNFAGAAETWYQPAHRREYLAIYRGTIKTPTPFTPNDEMSNSMWWNTTDHVAKLNAIDAALATLCP